VLAKRDPTHVVAMASSFTGMTHCFAPVHHHLDAEEKIAVLLAGRRGAPDADLEEQPDYLLLDILQHLPQQKADRLLSCLSARERALEDVLRHNRELSESCERHSQRSPSESLSLFQAGADRPRHAAEPAPEPERVGSAGPVSLERAVQKLESDNQVLAAQVLQLTRCMSVLDSMPAAAGVDGAAVPNADKHALASGAAQVEEGPAGLSVGVILQKIRALEMQLAKAQTEQESNAEKGASDPPKLPILTRMASNTKVGQLIQKFEGQLHQKSAYQASRSLPPTSDGMATPDMPPSRTCPRSADCMRTSSSASAQWKATAQLLEAAARPDEDMASVASSGTPPIMRPPPRRDLASPASPGTPYTPIMSPPRRAESVRMATTPVRIRPGVAPAGGELRRCVTPVMIRSGTLEGSPRVVAARPVLVHGVLPSAATVGSTARSLSPVAICSITRSGSPLRYGMPAATTTTHVYRRAAGFQA